MALNILKNKMAGFEKFIDEATTPGRNQKVPGCTVVVSDKTGIVYSKCSGAQSVDQSSPLSAAPMTLDITMWIASCTKLMTAISVLQCVERGLLELDSDISSILPEFRSPEILIGFEEGSGKPILQKAKNIITLRMLLNHSSGLCLVGMDPRLIQYRRYHGKWPPRPDESLHGVAFLPLLYEPGTGWSYGNGLEWAGQMVERVNRNQRLGDYMKAHIWGPLGMSSTTFRLEQRPDIRARLMGMTRRVPDTDELVHSPTRLWSETVPDDHGGAGVYSCPRDYVKLLSAILRDDGTLLTSSSIDQLFATPSLSSSSKAAMSEYIYKSRRAMPQSGNFALLLAGGIPQSANLDYALGGMVVTADIQSSAGVGLRRSKGALTWSGLPNLQWVIDRQAGIALFYATQLIPPGDRLAAEAFKQFEEAVNAKELISGKL